MYVVRKGLLVLSFVLTVLQLVVFGVLTILLAENEDQLALVLGAFVVYCCIGVYLNVLFRRKADKPSVLMFLILYALLLFAFGIAPLGVVIWVEYLLSMAK